MAREGAASSCQTSNLVFAILALTPRPGLGCPSAPPRSRLRFSRPDGQRITRQLFRDCPSDYRLSEGNRSQKRRPVGPRSPAGGPRSRLPEPSACRQAAGWDLAHVITVAPQVLTPVFFPGS